MLSHLREGFSLSSARLRGVDAAYTERRTVYPMLSHLHEGFSLGSARLRGVDAAYTEQRTSYPMLSHLREGFSLGRARPANTPSLRGFRAPTQRACGVLRRRTRSSARYARCYHICAKASAWAGRGCGVLRRRTRSSAWYAPCYHTCTKALAWAGRGQPTRPLCGGSTPALPPNKRDHRALRRRIRHGAAHGMPHAITPARRL